MQAAGRRRLAAALGCALAVIAAGPASAAPIRIAENDSVPLVSGNVTPLLTIPVSTPIGARFRDGLMYVTGSVGLSIYDVSDPRLPKPVGALPLPHFENEDVDMGGDLLLISNDPSEGVGVLYVIDISNPSTPTLKAAMPNDFIATGLPGLFGQEEPLPDGIGHTVSCVKADCSFAYLAGTSAGIDVVDLRDPANPKRAGRFKPDITDLTTHDVQVDAKGLAWIVGAGGTAAYDVTDPVNPRQVSRTDESIKNSGQLGVPGPDPVFGIGGAGETPIDLIHHNSLHYSKRLVAITEEDYNRPTCKGAGSFQTWGIAGKRLALLDMFTTELDNLVQGRGWAPVTGLCSAHYFDERQGLVAGGWYEEGTRFLDVRDPAGIRQVGYWVPTKGETWSVLFAPTDPKSEIVYALDFARGIDVLRIDRDDMRVRSAPVRRSWLRSPRGTGTARTGMSTRTDFGFVCRTATRRAVSGPRPPEPQIGVPVPLPELPKLPEAPKTPALPQLPVR
jgi:hypothetical protein